MKAFLAIFLLVVATAAFASAVDENSAPAPADDFDSAPAGEVTRGPAVAAVPVKPEEFGNFGMDNTSAEDRDVALGFGPSGSVPGARRRRQSGSCFRFNAAVYTYQFCRYLCGAYGRRTFIHSSPLRLCACC